MSRRWLVGLVLLSGCACTDLRGHSGLVVDVEMSVALPPGDYEFVARLDAVEIRKDWGESFFDGDVVVDGRTFFMDVFRSMSFLNVGFREGGGPEVVTIELWRDAAMMAQRTYTPDYEPYHPNGRHCGDDEQARDTFEVPAP